MSKYNLTDILNEYVGGSRHGTINISFRDLVDAMETIERQGDFVVREESFPSGDGKVNREFEVVYIGNARKSGKEEGGFRVYDYKFGFDPGDIDNYEEEYDFSIGGNNKKNALILARDLLGPAVKGYMGDDQEIVNSYTPQMANDIIMSLDRNMDDEGEMTDYAADVEIDSINEGHGLEKSDVDFLQSLVDRMHRGGEWKAEEFKPLKRILNFIIKTNIKPGDLKEAVGYIGDEPLAALMKMGTADMNLWHVVKLIDAGILKDSDKNKALKALDPSRPLDESKSISKKDQKLINMYRKNDEGKINEAVAEEESVANYLMDYYRNPNKPEETMVDEKIVGEYFETHEDWDLIWGKSYEEGLQDFEEFFDINYGIMFPSAGDIDEIDINTVQNDPGSGDADNPEGEELEASSGYDAAMESLKEHFNRFK